MYLSLIFRLPFLSGQGLNHPLSFSFAAKAEGIVAAIFQTDNHIAIKVGHAIVPLRGVPVGFEVGFAERIPVEKSEQRAVET